MWLYVCGLTCQPGALGISICNTIKALIFPIFNTESGYLNHKWEIPKWISIEITMIICF